MTTATAATSAAIPLTTVFTPPASCTSVNLVSSDCSKSTCDGLYNIVQTTDTNCYPSGWATTATWFSPGLYCPTGYTVNDTNVVTSGLGITETQARCCPSGYAFATQLQAPWWTPEPCTKISTTTTVLEFTILGATPTTTTAITYKNPIIHAYPIELRWQSTDSVDGGVKSSATVELTSSSGTSATSTSTSTGGASTSTGLSTGAKAGIGVGVAAAAIIAIILSLLFWVRRRRNQKAVSTLPSAGHTRGGSIFKKTPQQEPVELPTYTPELHGSFSPHSELDSSDRGFSERGYSEHGHSEERAASLGRLRVRCNGVPGRESDLEVVLQARSFSVCITAGFIHQGYPLLQNRRL
ncbi:uncharacterized protein N7473_010501 [Penicillium subrubescens]|uniref:uncharacterized protein n=1 Tax=Penicillium subrubescens TaxID=1316194 RepID=UPI0025454707|nr:uncharacterized protein N7473_010501 [Penicillium subrubescens]KAJ5883615.1 hypothetical protein N7473_010501 [Penicillium subrubescens]